MIKPEVLMMKELNQAVYYTTAQVTELVDLSDQNVRKYVRLLEDRKYEVAKDEHNRRLFSANDVLILRELIKKAKKPGYTLESAADEIVNEIGEIISTSGHAVSTGSNEDDIKEMFAHVIERLDAIQDENKDLKDNIRNLVNRLEQYDQYNSQRYLETSVTEEYNVDDKVSKSGENLEDDHLDKDIAPDDDNVKNDDDNNGNEETDNVIGDGVEFSSNTEEAKSTESIEEAPSVSENSEGNNIDMNEYNEEENESKAKQNGAIQQEDSHTSSQNDEKEGFFSGLFKMFKR